MRSGTSFFDWTIYRKNLSRFWPLWVINLVVWGFAMPLNGLMKLRYDAMEDYNPFAAFARNVGNLVQDGGLALAVVAGLAVAMAMCSHLYFARSANFMGALPARREGQFLSHYAAGLTMLLGPNVVVFLLTLLVELAAGEIWIAPLAFWLLAVSVMEFFFYSFAMCLGQFTGHLLALPFYYGVFNILVLGVVYMLEWVVGTFYFGFRSSWDLEWVKWFTPVDALGQVDFDVYKSSVSAVYEQRAEGWTELAVYAAVAVVLTAGALLLYRRRKLETAGDAVAVKAMRPVFKYGVALCAGMFLGYFTYEMFSLEELGLCISVVVWGVVGYFVAQMLLDKSFRVLKKWKGAAAVAVVFVVLFAAIAFDFTGFERRVPAASEVQSVTISGLNGQPYDDGAWLHSVELTDPESIQAVIDLHRGIVEVGEDGESYDQNTHYSWISFDVTYTLTNGRTLSRGYNVRAGSTLLPLAQKVLDQYEVRRLAYGLDQIEAAVANGEILFDAVASSDLTEAWYLDKAELLWEAVMTDFETGRIGIHTIGSSSYTYGEVKTQEVYAYGGNQELQVSFDWAIRQGTAYNPTRSLTITVLETSAETLRVLAELQAEGSNMSEALNG